MRFVLVVTTALGIAFLGALIVPRRYRLGLWTLLIVAVVVPWTDFQGHAHWSTVGWSPFVSPPVRLRDIAVNLVLYVPFGLFFVQQVRPRVLVVLGATLAGVALSLVTEWAQVYSHTRFPTLTDVVMNGAGACLGAAIGWMLTRFLTPVTRA